MMRHSTRSHRGYTMIELLIVLVITALTTALMVTGLGTTWRNFEKLSSRDLTVRTARLPLLWFSDSFEGAQLYHPEKVMFSGTSAEMHFITFNAPNVEAGLLREISWSIRQNELVYQAASDNAPVQVYPLGSDAHFEYLGNTGWLPVFTEQKGLLPSAVRIVQQGRVIVMALPGRPAVADMPPELPVYGKYEF